MAQPSELSKNVTMSLNAVHRYLMYHSVLSPASHALDKMEEDGVYQLSEMNPTWRTDMLINPWNHLCRTIRKRQPVLNEFKTLILQRRQSIACFNSKVSGRPS